MRHAATKLGRAIFALGLVGLVGASLASSPVLAAKQHHVVVTKQHRATKEHRATKSHVLKPEPRLVVRVGVKASPGHLVVVARAYGGSTCTLTVETGKESAHFAPVRLGHNGRGIFRWSVPSNAPSGRWSFIVGCSRGRALGRSEAHVLVVNAGNGRGAIVASAKGQAPVGGGKGGGDWSCAAVAEGGTGQVCFLNDPFAIYQNGTDVGQCTWYAAGMRPDLDGIDTGNASAWLRQARGRRPEGTVPVVGAIAVNTTSDGGLGHVAYVAGISGSTLILDEANLRYDAKVYLNIRTPASDFQGYIYGGPAGNGPVASSPVPTPVPTPTPAPAPTYIETAGGTVTTWSDYAVAGGTEGPAIGSGESVLVYCRASGFGVADGNTWWYQIASSPWSGNYYASADAFYNDGATSGSLMGTPFYDAAVPVCNATKGAPVTTAIVTNTTAIVTTTTAGATTTTTTSTTPATTGTTGTTGTTVTSATTSTTGQTSTSGTTVAPVYDETVGGVAHTWTDYADAGGSQGPSIAAYQTVQVSCAVQGFKVPDGNPWWYRIASAPWDNVYYVSADAFYNDGSTSGSLLGTPWVDPAVPQC